MDILLIQISCQDKDNMEKYLNVKNKEVMKIYASK